MKKTRCLIVLALAAAFSSASFAQASPPQAAVLAASAPGKGAVIGKVTLSATVVAIDATTRTLTLKGPKGNVVDLVAPPEMKHFADIRVGDMVTTEYVRALSLELKPTGSSVRSSTSQSATAPAPAGAVAGGGAARQVVVMANVTAVNTKENYVTLRGPKGNSVELSVDPSQLKLVKVGDQVEAVYTEALAITIDHQPKAAKK